VLVVFVALGSVSHLGKDRFVFRSPNRHHLQNLQSHKPHPLRSELGGILSRSIHVCRARCACVPEINLTDRTKFY